MIVLSINYIYLFTIHYRIIPIHVLDSKLYQTAAFFSYKRVAYSFFDIIYKM